MNESWAIAMATLAGTAVLAVIGSFLREIKAAIEKINTTLTGMVSKDDCDKDMTSHCNQLTALQADTSDITARLRALETKVEMLHK